MSIFTVISDSPRLNSVRDNSTSTTLKSVPSKSNFLILSAQTPDPLLLIPKIADPCPVL